MALKLYMLISIKVFAKNIPDRFCLSSFSLAHRYHNILGHSTNLGDISMCLIINYNVITDDESSCYGYFD